MNDVSSEHSNGTEWLEKDTREEEAPGGNHEFMSRHHPKGPHSVGNISYQTTTATTLVQRISQKTQEIFKGMQFSLSARHFKLQSSSKYIRSRSSMAHCGFQVGT